MATGAYDPTALCRQQRATIWLNRSKVKTRLAAKTDLLAKVSASQRLVIVPRFGAFAHT
jgi:hypothetical protein